MARIGLTKETNKLCTQELRKFFGYSSAALTILFIQIFITYTDESFKLNDVLVVLVMLYPYILKLIIYVSFMNVIGLVYKYFFLVQIKTQFSIQSIFLDTLISNLHKLISC